MTAEEFKAVMDEMKEARNTYEERLHGLMLEYTKLGDRIAAARAFLIHNCEGCGKASLVLSGETTEMDGTDK